MNANFVKGTQGFTPGEQGLAVLYGIGPTSYSTAGDVISNPGAGYYIQFPMQCTTKSGTYTLRAVPVATNEVRAGATSPSASGWAWHWYVISTGAEVAGAVDLSAESVQFGAIGGQL